MINANELRIGNFVEKEGCIGFIDIIQDCPNDLFKKVSFKSDHLNGEFKFEEIFPIPLTPSMPIKSGFELLSGSRGMYMIFIDDLRISVSVEFSFAYIDTKWGQAPIKKPLFKYVHSLQNLIFALTGKILYLSLSLHLQISQSLKNKCKLK